jgi:hypothetical protein
MQQAHVVQHHENKQVRNIGQGEARHRKYEVVRHMTVHVITYVAT